MLQRKMKQGEGDRRDMEVRDGGSGATVLHRFPVSLDRCLWIGDENRGK